MATIIAVYNKRFCIVQGIVAFLLACAVAFVGDIGAYGVLQFALLGASIVAAFGIVVGVVSFAFVSDDDPGAEGLKNLATFQVLLAMSSLASVFAIFCFFADAPYFAVIFAVLAAGLVFGTAVFADAKNGSGRSESLLLLCLMALPLGGSIVVWQAMHLFGREERRPT